jgi:hypothetical protein
MPRSMTPRDPSLDREHSTTPSAAYGRGHYAAAEQSKSKNPATQSALTEERLSESSDKAANEMRQTRRENPDDCIFLVRCICYISVNVWSLNSDVNIARWRRSPSNVQTADN